LLLKIAFFQGTDEFSNLDKGKELFIYIGFGQSGFVAIKGSFVFSIIAVLFLCLSDIKGMI